MNKEDTQEENGEGELGFGDEVAGRERPPREKRSPPVLSRGMKADEDVPDREAEGDHEQGDERHGFWDIPCIVRSLHLRAHDAHERDTYGEANKQDRRQRTLELVCSNFCTTFLSKKAIGCMNSSLFLVPIMLSVYSF